MQWIVDARKQDTKLPQLIRAAVRLFVEQGIDATTTKQIAAAADVAEGTIYRHFKSKDEMATALFLTHLDAFTRELDRAAAAETETEPKLKAIIRCYFEFFEAERTLFEYVLQAEHRELRRYPATFRQPLHVVLDLVAEGIQQGDVPDQDATLAAAYIIGIVHRVSVFRSYDRMKDNLVRYVDDVAAACRRAIGEGARAR